MLKRLVAKMQIAPTKESGEARLKEMETETGFVYGYMTGFDDMNDFSVVGLYNKENAPELDNKEVFVYVKDTEEILLWPDGTWVRKIMCTMGHIMTKGDDYIVIEVDTNLTDEELEEVLYREIKGR